MKRLTTAVLMALSLLTAAACTRVDPGWEGIKVDMLAQDRGAAVPIVFGRVWYNPYSEQVYEFPIHTQRVLWDKDGDDGVDESITFRSKEGYAFNADVAFAAGFRANSSPKIFLKWRREAYDVLHGPFRDVVREAYVEIGSQMPGLSVLGTGMPQLNDQVTKLVRERLGEYADIDYVNIVGKPRVDAQVESSINAVITASQQANVAVENVRKAQAEAQSVQAKAEGDAIAMERLATAKATSIRIESEALRQFGQGVIELRAIEKWDGTMPHVVGGSGAVPFINVPSSR